MCRSRVRWREQKDITTNRTAEVSPLFVRDYTTIREGLAYILQFNCDLSVLAIKTFREDFVTRKRQKHEAALKKLNRQKKRKALHYAKEIPFTTTITANSLSSLAIDSIKLNVKYNKLEEKIKANTSNAIAYMYSFVKKISYKAINDSGLLCVTCTDSASFASHGYLEKTYLQYSGLPFKGEPCHEGGLYMAIKPLLLLSIDYYIYVFVCIRKALNNVKLLASKTMIIYHY
ncbi:uncharacterized protein BDR25DRAFT_330005 [Lindgomyces ingoldianus]|uniref:Uncharacterized protein n=1 Tax=Lindgomyces ingoldianus TaxID=673940 RepID=A0ACB6Q974_9PLEO|nr:uncharacterized protein BDR25DRAFT_330005 [Lindgomyces ingoldianus]KAF2462912.1 hypothetical protein BDR25DRAFT_330005 [Lindgomyces ingoldianus]